MIHKLSSKGLSISEIARQLGRDRKTVRKAVQPAMTFEFFQAGLLG